MRAKRRHGGLGKNEEAMERYRRGTVRELSQDYLKAIYRIVPRLQRSFISFFYPTLRVFASLALQPGL